MKSNDEVSSRGRDRKIEFVCGVVLDLRTQGLYCPPCRAKKRMERKRNMDAAWERFHRRHSEPARSDAPSADVGALIGVIERLVDALESGRAGYGRYSRPSTSLVLPTRSAAQPRDAVGIPADRMEWE